MEIYTLKLPKRTTGVKHFSPGALSAVWMLPSPAYFWHSCLLLRIRYSSKVWKDFSNHSLLFGTLGENMSHEKMGRYFTFWDCPKSGSMATTKQTLTLGFDLSLACKTKNEQISCPVSSDKRALPNPSKFCLTCYHWKYFFMNLNVHCLLSFHFSSFDWATSIPKLILLLSRPPPPARSAGAENEQSFVCSPAPAAAAAAMSAPQK